MTCAKMEAKGLLCAWRGQNVRKRVRKTRKVMQADFAEEGLIDLSHAAKGGDPEKQRVENAKRGRLKGQKAV